MAFRFLKSLFSASADATGKYSDKVIAAALERVIDGTDPRLRAVPRYRHKLWEAVEHSVQYTAKLVADLPASVNASYRQFTSTPLLRAAFVSPDHLRETLSFSKHTHDYQQQTPGRLPKELYGLLGVERVEKTMHGIGMQEGIMQREVPRTVINFCNHRFIFPSDSELLARQAVTKRAFDSLIAAALQQLTTVRNRREELEQRQQMLRKKAHAMHCGQIGLGELLAAAPLNQADASTLERQLLDIQEELAALRADSATIGHLLERVIATLQHPEQHLQVERVTLTLDHLNSKVESDTAPATNTLTFHEARFEQRRMALFLVRFPSEELLPQPDFFQEALKMFTPRLMT